MDEIERLPSPAAVTRQLQNIPNGLVQLYQTKFSAVEKALSPLQLNLAQQLFIWIDMMDFVRVGRGALDREILDIVFQAANSGDAVFDSVDLAQKLCSPLITLKTVLPQDRYHSRSTNTSTTISVVHRTALEFIRQSSARDTTPTPVPRILKPQALKALYRANTAVCKTGVFFEMSYALWHAFLLRTLPAGLDDDDLEQASLLCNRLTSFLLSGRCMKWIKMAMIVNYNGGYVTLYHHAVSASTAATQSTIISDRDTEGKSLPAFQEFSIARKQFFADCAYVVSCTGPTDGKTMTMPQGFGSRPLAANLMRLGMAWTHLYQAKSGKESD
ncbi:hypothetical protein BJX61DRAFT_546401 [Aspergillus egyptiacus]|nr:hypothetical protein BJX61DRAFT_546401 [Aspergillus egyptiacus]